MDKTPKSKWFGFKKGGRSHEQSSPSDSRSLSENDVIDLENLPIAENAIPTSPAVCKTNAANHLSTGQCSPQFVVGWNDGPESDDLYMRSPIRTAPVLRNIRRCPDNYNFKVPKKKLKDNKEDILQCIDWSKNLFETTSRQEEALPKEEKMVSPKEEKKVSPKEKKMVSPKDEKKVSPDEEILFPDEENVVTEPGIATEDLKIDILDDSAVDEMMVLCSQAVEQSLPVPRNPPVSPVSSKIPGKHPLTPDDHSRKRLKIDTASNAASQYVEEKRKADNNSVNLNSNIKKCNHIDFKIPPCNKSNSKQEMKSVNPAVASKVTSKVLPSSGRNQNLFESLLNDDEDDLFGSFDFCSIDKKLQTTQTRGGPSKSVSSHANISVPKFKNNINPPAKPIPKYTKEQIEQRRLEAKKRLLFNKKYKSL